ncbi:MAG TPA: VTT domain-containing protein, partial [Vicinamibacterales bacterium]|nr:VTT domain-containing protein [Vicinamibacterales bacterium]
GNSVNFAVGRFIGPRVFTGTYRLLNKAYLDRAHAFFEQHGGKAIVLARFVPIVRTFVPFVAGAAQMTTATFVLYNAVGAVSWVALCLGAGWFFGNIPIIKNNFSLVTIGIVFVSILPMLFEIIAHRRRQRRA